MENVNNSINDSVNRRVVISALEVVEARLGVVVVAAVAEGVGVCEGAGGGQYLAVGVVGVGISTVILLYVVMVVKRYLLKTGNEIIKKILAGRSCRQIPIYRAV